QSSLCLGSLTAQVDSDGHTVQVSLTIQNTTASNQSGKAFWLISAAGEGPPWDRAIYQSASKQLRIGPHHEVRAQWKEDVLVGDGFYDFSAWVHVQTPNGQSVHSDGRASAPL